ncbi:hypothetical protein F2P56_033824 [Juglans regia]|uniref:Uncharacterized protein LOC109019015 n=2 Tax=Juglans regia TaxID=51240 RepID=A0A2I4HKT4_JUGRE|nr:uncharacterized protein LOC109019015 [Juglans regia]KAF5444716.1 hypothetical protein F2P56_033824 [Juglans regia]
MDQEDQSYKLLMESRARNAPLLLAALEDDWKSAKAFIGKDRDCVRAAITEEQRTALHSAVATKNTRFVKELVKLMKPEDLELKDNLGCTALYFAAQSRIVAIAKEMVEKNKELPAIPKDDAERLPLYAAVKTGNRDMVSYLYSFTPLGKEDMNSKDRIELLNAAISTELYGMFCNVSFIAIL